MSNRENKRARRGARFGRAAAALAMAVALVAPAVAPAGVQSASAATDLPGPTKPDGDMTYRHGVVTIDADAAVDGVITLKEGQTAIVRVSPYQHIQYRGCGKPDCPEKCESVHGVQCFVKGMGCKCEHTPVTRTAKVTSTVADPSIASAGDIVADEAWSTAGNEDLHDSSRPVTKDGAITLTAGKPGETTVTVAAETDETGDINNDSGNTSTLLEWWVPATKTYTVKVVADAGKKDPGITFPGDPQYVSTDMGRSPAGKVDFALESTMDGAAVKQWAESVTSVTLDGKKLTAKAFDEWKKQLTNPVDDVDKLPYYELAASGTSQIATLKLPIVAFDATKPFSTKKVVIEAVGYKSVTGEVTYRNIAAQKLVVRILSADGKTVMGTRVLSLADLQKLPVQKRYSTSSNCGMAGLRSFMSEGVLLTDVLKAANVDFGPGMTLRLRVNDYLDQNGDETTTEPGYVDDGKIYTYESLIGTKRYYYPGMWDTTPRAELGGKSLYEILSGDMNAWKGYDTTVDAATGAKIRALLGETKQQVAPVLAWRWNEGVVAWGGENPAARDGYNEYTGQETFRLLYGLKAADDGSIVDDITTQSNVYGVFGIDVVGGRELPEGTGFSDVPTGHWVYGEGWLQYVTSHGLMGGYQGRFAPEGNLTRGQVAAVLYRVANPNSDATTNPEHYGDSTGFADGGSQPYYFAAVKWLKEQGISTGDKAADGTPLNTFRPDDPITRQELAAMVYRFAKSQGSDVSGADAGVLGGFRDGGEVQPYAREAMAWCNERGILTGGKGAAEGLLMPGQNATRAQAAKIFTVVHRDVLGK